MNVTKVIVLMQDFNIQNINTLFSEWQGLIMASSSFQKNMPGRFKAFHYYNAGTLFDAMMAFAKPFLDKKYKERVSSSCGTSIQLIF